MALNKQTLRDGIIQEMTQVEFLVQVSKELFKKNRLLMEEIDKIKNLTRSNYKVKLHQERANIIRRIIQKIEAKKDSITKKIEEMKTLKK